MKCGGGLAACHASYALLWLGSWTMPPRLQDPHRPHVPGSLYHDGPSRLERRITLAALRTMWYQYKLWA
jgi:hypothetical protein